MQLEKDSRRPLYVQLMAEIKNMIRTGKYAAGDRIPTEPELAEMYGVSRITVRKTIELLCQEGYLTKQQGKGTFVDPPKIYRKIEVEKSVGFSEACHVNGRIPTSHVLSIQRIKAEKWHASFFPLEKEERLLSIRRIMSADDVPILLEQLYFPENKFKDLDGMKLENASLYALLKAEYGFTEPPRSKSTIEAGTADKENAELLHILRGEPILILCNYMWDSKGEPAYISLEQIVGSRYRITF